jgi:D-amino peptidase
VGVEGRGVWKAGFVRIYISVDMEGISGVTRWEDVITSGQDYQRARSWMTADVNAAVVGARAAGATDFVVEENHGVEMLCNLLLDEIDPEVEVVRGLPRGGATTMAALDDSFDAMFLVGHHAKARDYPGIGAHTISYGDYADVRMDGRTIGEPEMFITAAAQCGVPAALIAGDDIVCADVATLVPGIATAVVKQALSHTAGAIIPPVRAQRIISDAAANAVERVKAGTVAPIEFGDRFDFEVELRKELTDDARAAIEQRFPEFTIVGDRTLAFSHAEMKMAFRMAAISSFLAKSPAAVRHY